jgi:hypothetical protein
MNRPRRKRPGMGRERTNAIPKSGAIAFEFFYHTKECGGKLLPNEAFPKLQFLGKQP